MLALRSFHALAELADVRKQEQESIEADTRKRERRQRREARQDAMVAGGVYQPEPVNKEAAMLLAKAPWYAVAPTEPQFNEAIEPKKARRTIMPEREAYRQYTKGSDPTFMQHQKDGEPLVNMDELAIRMVAEIETNVPKHLRELAQCAVNARTLLDESIKGIGGSMDEFDRVTKDARQHIQDGRMAIVRDCSQMVHALKDIRQFFLGPDYEHEQKRLADFVELCERLRVLKDSGFLDTVADTMIRLASTAKED